MSDETLSITTEGNISMEPSLEEYSSLEDMHVENWCKDDNNKIKKYFKQGVDNYYLVNTYLSFSYLNRQKETEILQPLVKYIGISQKSNEILFLGYYKDKSLQARIFNKDCIIDFFNTNTGELIKNSDTLLENLYQNTENYKWEATQNVKTQKIKNLLPFPFAREFVENGYESINDILTLSEQEILNIPNIGKKSLTIINNYLNEIKQ